MLGEVVWVVDIVVDMVRRLALSFAPTDGLRMTSVGPVSSGFPPQGG